MKEDPSPASSIRKIIFHSQFTIYELDLTHHWIDEHLSAHWHLVY